MLALSQGDLQAVFADFQKTNPELAKIIGSAEALQGVALWAFKTGGADAAGGNATFADNLNIRRSPLGDEKITDMGDVTRRSSTNTGSWDSKWAPPRPTTRSVDIRPRISPSATR